MRNQQERATPTAARSRTYLSTPTLHVRGLTYLLIKPTISDYDALTRKKLEIGLIMGLIAVNSGKPLRQPYVSPRLNTTHDGGR